MSKNVQFLEDKFDHFSRKPESQNIIHAGPKNFTPDENEEIEEVTELLVPKIPIVRQQNDEPVEAQARKTFEDKLMEQVKNLSPVREWRLPQRFLDETCRFADSLTSEMNEPKSVDEE